MLRHLPLLMRIYQTVKLRHLFWAIGLFMLVVCGTGSALGAMNYGWKGGVLAPVALLLMMLLALHLWVVISLALGMVSHRRGRTRTALFFLWPAAVFRRYDRKGHANQALLENRNRFAAQMMQKMAMNFMSGR